MRLSERVSFHSETQTNTEKERESESSSDFHRDILTDRDVIKRGRERECESSETSTKTD
jgi:hypothetical protein